MFTLIFSLIASLFGGSSQAPTPTDGLNITVTDQHGNARKGCTIAPSWDNRENIHRTDNNGTYTFTPAPTAGTHKVSVYCDDNNATQDITVTKDAKQSLRITVAQR